MTLSAPNQSNVFVNSIISWLSNDKKDELYDALKNDKENREKEYQKKRNEVVKELTKNHVKVEWNIEMFWCKGVKLHIDLPAVGKFKWYNFDCFLSEEHRNQKFVSEHPEVEEKMYSMDDISKLLDAIRSYMENSWVSIPNEWNIKKNMRYRERDHFTKKDWIRYRDAENLQNEEWNILKEITGLNWMFLLKDKRLKEGKDYHYGWLFHNQFNFFNTVWVDDSSLLLKSE